MITHMTPECAGLRFDPVTGLGLLPVAVHHDDSKPVRVALFLEPGDMRALFGGLCEALDRAEHGPQRGAVLGLPGARGTA